MPLRIPTDVCSFCDYLAGRRRFTILDRNELVAMLVTREQRGVGHVLVVPVQHRPSILDLCDGESAALMDGVRRASAALAGCHDPDGIAVWQNNGTPAHQTVPHVHFHVAGTLPEGGTRWGPVPALDLAETDRIADALRPYLPPA